MSSYFTENKVRQFQISFQYLHYCTFDWVNGFRPDYLYKNYLTFKNYFVLSPLKFLTTSSVTIVYNAEFNYKALLIFTFWTYSVRKALESRFACICAWVCDWTRKLPNYTSNETSVWKICYKPLLQELYIFSYKSQLGT